MSNKKSDLSRSRIYLNGNYVVTQNRWSSDCTKRALRHGEELISAFPDSIDLKITNKCSYGCPWCHEESVEGGKTFDLGRLKSVLSGLPKDVPLEIAIGGGDIFSEPEATLELLEWIDKETEWLPRITLNWRSIRDIRGKTTNDTEGKIIKYCDIGISIDSMDAFTQIAKIFPAYEGSDDDEEEKLDMHFRRKKSWKEYQEMPRPIYRSLRYSTLVFHIIAGLFPVTFLDKTIEMATHDGVLGGRILILGYKDWGRGKAVKPQHLDEWKERVAEIIKTDRSAGKIQAISSMTLGFDNLALSQLDIKSLINPIEWRSIFMGDEGTHSMYVDAVKEEFSISSTCPTRVSWNDTDLLSFFKDAANNRG